MSLKILIAEDDAQGRYLLEQSLKAAGHEVFSAEDGPSALALARQAPPDVIVSDALMPRMDGFQLCLALRRDAQLSSIPFIIYTATYTEDADADLAHRAGVDRFLLKPDQESLLLPAILELTHPEARTAAERPPVQEPSQALLEEYSRRVSLKLEAKVAELQCMTDSLRQSEQEVRNLNLQLRETITRLEAEALKRQRAEELLELAQTVGHVGFWGRELDTGEAWWTEEAVRLLGLPSGTPRTGVEQILALTHPEDRERFAALMDTVRREHVNLDHEIRVVRPDGELRYLQLRMEAFRSADGKPQRRIGSVQDISERKRAEAENAALEQRLMQAQKMEALGNLAGGVAHDFNNLLAIIFSHAELLELELPAGSALSQHVKDHVQGVIDAASRARELVQQILSFSRRQPVERKPVDPAIITRSTARLVRPILSPEVELQVQCRVEGRLISAHEGQLQQVLINLIKNASHAIGDRRGRITVKLDVARIDAAFAASHPPLRPGECMVLSVQDTGCGIPPEALQHIFEPFFTTKGEGVGTGLGLAVVYGIVNSHEGAISVESEPGHGTLFTIWLPLLRANRPSLSPDGSSPPTTARGERILFVDDEPSVAKISVRLLTRLGYRAEAMTDPVAARDRLCDGRDDFDLVITDYLMPRLTGFDLADAVWKVRPNLPILLAAGFGGQVEAERARKAGFRALLSKPFTLQAISEACGAALQKAPAPSS